MHSPATPVLLTAVICQDFIYTRLHAGGIHKDSLYKKSTFGGLENHLLAKFEQLFVGRWSKSTEVIPSALICTTWSPMVEMWLVEGIFWLADFLFFGFFLFFKLSPFFSSISAKSSFYIHPCRILLRHFFNGYCIILKGQIHVPLADSACTHTFCLVNIPQSFYMNSCC